VPSAIFPSKNRTFVLCAVTFHCRLCRNTTGETSTARRGVRRQDGQGVVVGFGQDPGQAGKSQG
jgi:hypothetical protein